MVNKKLRDIETLKRITSSEPERRTSSAPKGSRAWKSSGQGSGNKNKRRRGIDVPNTRVPDSSLSIWER